MKSSRILLALIGGWILFIGLDSTNGHMGARGARFLNKPLQLAFFITKILRTLVLFFIAAGTLLLVVRGNNGKQAD